MKKYMLLMAFLSFSSLSQDGDELGGRMNVMECSHEEVAAYMDLPDPDRRAMNDYYKWQAAFKSAQSVKEESDPRNCIAVLYGDLGVMADKLKKSTERLMTMQLPSMSEVTSKVMDKLSSSICKRVKTATTSLRDSVITNYRNAKELARYELMQAYGKEAMERYVTDAVIPPEYQAQGLEYRNDSISVESFRSNTRKRWQRELEELKN